jgi:hypothetical protein
VIRGGEEDDGKRRLNRMCPCFNVSHPDVFFLIHTRYKFQSTQQFIIQNILLATCFDSIESSSDLPKNRSNVSKFIEHSGIPNA